jgi:hypothetical protein
MATQNNVPTKAAPVAAPAPATVVQVPALPTTGKCGGIAPTTLYRLGTYNAKGAVNAHAWAQVQACVQANGGTATAQQIANVLAGCPNITSNAMLKHMATAGRASKTGALLVVTK